MQCPITFDKGALRVFLNEAWDNLIPLPGSNIEEAIKLAKESFQPGTNSTERFVVLITDGEQLQGDASAAVDELKKERNETSENEEEDKKD